MSGKEGCVIDREGGTRWKSHKTDSSAARLIAVFGPWHVSRDHFGPTISAPSGQPCARDAPRRATATGIAWLQVVPGVRPGGSSKPDGFFTSLTADLCCFFMRGLQCDHKQSHVFSFFTCNTRFLHLHVHLLLPLVRNPVSHAVSFDNATSAWDIFHHCECDTLSSSCIFFTLYIVYCETQF